MAEKTNGTKAQGGITKMETVRQALAKLGKNALPSQIRDFVKQHFGIEMSNDHVSVCKGKILKGKAAAKKPATVKAAARKTEAKKAAAPKAGSATGGVPLQDVLTVKDLVVRLGAEQVRTLLDAFSR